MFTVVKDINSVVQKWVLFGMTHSYIPLKRELKVFLRNLSSQFRIEFHG